MSGQKCTVRAHCKQWTAAELLAIGAGLAEARHLTVHGFEVLAGERQVRSMAVFLANARLLVNQGGNALMKDWVASGPTPGDALHAAIDLVRAEPLPSVSDPGGSGQFLSVIFGVTEQREPVPPGPTGTQPPAQTVMQRRQ